MNFRYKLKSAQIATAAGWYQQACAALGGLVVVPSLLESLGREAAGSWLAILSIISIFSLSDFGFSMAISRQVTRSLHKAHATKEEVGDFISTNVGWLGVEEVYLSSRRIFFLITLLGSSTLLMTLWLGFSLSELASTTEQIPAHVWILSTISFSTLFYGRLYQSVLDGAGQMHISRLVSGTYQLVLAGITILLLSQGHKIASLAVALSIASLAQLFALHIAFERRVGIHLPLARDTSARNNIALKLLKVAIPFGVSMAGAHLINFAQMPLVGSALGAAAVVPVYITIKILQVLNTAIGQGLTAQTPLFVMEFTMGHLYSARVRMQQTILRGAGAYIIAGAMMYYCSPMLISFWVGSAMTLSDNILLAFVLNFVLSGVAALPTQFVLGMGRNPFPFMTLMHGAIAIAATIFFVKELGVLAVPLACLFALAITNFWFTPLHGFGAWVRLKTERF